MVIWVVPSCVQSTSIRTLSEWQGACLLFFFLDWISCYFKTFWRIKCKKKLNLGNDKQLKVFVEAFVSFFWLSLVKQLQVVRQALLSFTSGSNIHLKWIFLWSLTRARDLQQVLDMGMREGGCVIGLSWSPCYLLSCDLYCFHFELDKVQLLL